MAVDMVARAMAGSNGGGGEFPTPIIETFAIMRTEWIPISQDQEEYYAPYKYNKILQAQTEITDDMVISLINDNPVRFANCGFAIKSVYDNNIEFIAIKDPNVGISLDVMFSKYKPAR